MTDPDVCHLFAPLHARRLLVRSGLFPLPCAPVEALCTMTGQMGWTHRESGELRETFHMGLGSTTHT